jgi:hypothetical protein
MGSWSVWECLVLAFANLHIAQALESSLGPDIAGPTEGLVAAEGLKGSRQEIVVSLATLT